jgi:AmmeMemoRadiSam system protein A
MSHKEEKLGPAASLAVVRVARKSLEKFVRHDVIYHPDLAVLPSILSDPGASFVTITNHGKLRGCIGNTEATYPLAQDVARNAISAATRDYRFPAVMAQELPEIRLEVTILTPLKMLTYHNYDDLLTKIRPGIDGVILSSGDKRGLLLPQVWDRIPEPDRFLEMIALKAGMPKRELGDDPPSVTVQTFEAHHYAEPGYQEPGG